MPKLVARGIVKRFGLTTALDGAELTLEHGEVHALVGENGSGKSTLVRIISGEIQADEGQMTIDGQEYAPQEPRDAQSHGVALIHQELALCPHLSVEDSIGLGREAKRFGILNLTQTASNARVVLNQLGHKDVSPKALIQDLPIALQQVVEIARALATGADLLMFDEPTSSL